MKPRPGRAGVNRPSRPLILSKHLVNRDTQPDRISEQARGQEGWFTPALFDETETRKSGGKPPFPTCDPFEAPCEPVIRNLTESVGRLVVRKTSEVFCQPCCTLEHPGGVLGAG